MTCPIFVTWTKGKNDDLRGCIGTFEPEDLSHILSKYAMLAAFEDDRFEPIQRKEIPDLKVGLSLLVNFQEKPLKNNLDWEVGRHGVSMELKHDG